MTRPIPFALLAIATGILANAQSAQAAGWTMSWSTAGNVESTTSNGKSGSGSNRGAAAFSTSRGAPIEVNRPPAGPAHPVRIPYPN